MTTSYLIRYKYACTTPNNGPDEIQYGMLSTTQPLDEDPTASIMKMLRETERTLADKCLVKWVVLDRLWEFV